MTDMARRTGVEVPMATLALSRFRKGIVATLTVSIVVSLLGLRAPAQVKGDFDAVMHWIDGNSFSVSLTQKYANQDGKCTVKSAVILTKTSD